MKLIPDSNGEDGAPHSTFPHGAGIILEVNTCHGKGRGHPCGSGQQRSLDFESFVKPSPVPPKEPADLEADKQRAQAALVDKHYAAIEQEKGREAKDYTEHLRWRYVLAWKRAERERPDLFMIPEPGRETLGEMMGTSRQEHVARIKRENARLKRLAKKQGGHA